MMLPPRTPPSQQQRARNLSKPERNQRPVASAGQHSANCQSSAACQDQKHRNRPAMSGAHSGHTGTFSPRLWTPLPATMVATFGRHTLE